VRRCAVTTISEIPSESPVSAIEAACAKLTEQPLRIPVIAQSKFEFEFIHPREASALEAGHRGTARFDRVMIHARPS